MHYKWMFYGEKYYILDQHESGWIQHKIGNENTTDYATDFEHHERPCLG